MECKAYPVLHDLMVVIGSQALTFAGEGFLPFYFPLALFSTPRFGVSCPHPQNAAR